MAVRSATKTILSNEETTQVVWEQITEADTGAAYTCLSTQGVLGAVQVIGTMGGATVAMQASNDGTNWWNLKDTSGTEIGLTAAGGADFSTAALYVRPSPSGGSSQDLDVYLIMRSQ